MALDDFRREEAGPTWLEGVRATLMARWKIIAVVLGGIVLSILAFVGFWQYQERALEKAQAEFYSITSASDEAGRPPKVEEFARAHHGEEIAPVALMWLGAHYKKSGDLAKASEFYRSVIAEGGAGGPVTFVAVEALAPILMERGEISEAAALHLEASVWRGNPDPFSSKLKAASIFEVGGNTAEAKKILEALAADEKTPEEVRFKAEERILWLKVSTN